MAAAKKASFFSSIVGLQLVLARNLFVAEDQHICSGESLKRFNSTSSTQTANPVMPISSPPHQFRMFSLGCDRYAFKSGGHNAFAPSVTNGDAGRCASSL